MAAGISEKQIPVLKKLYLDEGLSMRQIAEHFGVTIDSVVYAMRKNGIPRRSPAETNSLLFQKKKPSFTKVKNLSRYALDLHIAGAMLYWGEGSKSIRGGTVDLANSDPAIIRTFLLFLRTSYILDEKRFRIYLYCYSNQDVQKLLKFWSSITAIPLEQFSRPYIREDFSSNGRVMRYGMIHVRYSDKKLLLDILQQVDRYKEKFCVGTQAVNEGSL